MKVLDYHQLSDEIDELDTFICSASFEERCLTVPTAFHNARLRPRQGLLVYNENFIPLISTNLEALRSLNICDMECAISTDDPVFTADRLSTTLTRCISGATLQQRIGVDITTFTRESLLMLLSFLWRNLRDNDELLLFYNRAREYDPIHGHGEKWLSKGIREIRSIIGFPGDLRPSLPTHLIVMAGYEGDRASRLILECEPAVISFGLPNPQEGHAIAHQETAELELRSIRRIGGDVENFSFNGYDPNTCATSLENQINLFGDMNTIIAPMNTKISTVGAGIIGYRMPQIQICYAQADLYNYKTYSEAANEVYVFSASQA